MGNAPASWAVPADAAGAREVAPGVWRLRLPLPWASTPHVNAYAVDGENGGTVLIDCGGAGDESAWEALLHALAEAGRSVDDVVEVVVTHAHSDHAGFASRIHARTGSRLWLPPGPSYAVDAIRRRDALAETRVRCARHEGVPEDRLHRFADLAEELEGIAWPLRPDRDLVAGAQVPSALGPLVAVDTPGHAPAHVALLAADAGLLFSADLLTAVYAGSFDVGYDDDPVAQWLASLDKAERLGASVALPGHGRPIVDLPSALTANRAGLQARLDAVGARLASGPQTAYELLQWLHPDAVGSDTEAWRLGEALAYLRHLERSGRARRIQGDDHVTRHAV